MMNSADKFLIVVTTIWLTIVALLAFAHSGPRPGHGEQPDRGSVTGEVGGLLTPKDVVGTIAIRRSAPSIRF